MNIRTPFIALLLVATLVTFYAPEAAAHTCRHADPRECDGRDCPEEEAHDHRDYNDDAEDDHCRSYANKGSCKVVGFRPPEDLCPIIQEGPFPA